MMAIARGSPFRVSRRGARLTMTDERARSGLLLSPFLAVDAVLHQTHLAPLEAPPRPALRVGGRAARARHRAAPARPRRGGAPVEGTGSSARRPRPRAHG